MLTQVSEKTQNDKEEEYLRRTKLKVILDKYFFSIASLAEKLNISRANLSTLLSGNRPFSLYTASKIETSLALPLGYLSSNSSDEYELSDSISAKYYEDMKYLVGTSFEKNINLPKEIVRQLKLNSTDEIIVSYMNDDLMYPTIKPNEMIFVATHQNRIEENKIYLIEINGFYRVRRLMVDKSIISVHIDNPDKKKTYITKSFDLDDIVIMGKVVGLISDLN